MERSRHIAKAGAALLVAATLALLPASAVAYPNKGGGFASGKTTITLDGGLRRALEAEGIRMTPIAPGKAKGKGVALPISEGGIEPRFGTGYVFLRGGIQLRAEGRAVSIRRLILNTAKQRLTGVIAGHAGTIASIDDVKARRTDLGATLKVETLRLTKKAAALLGARLAVKDVFRTGRLLGRAFAAGPWFHGSRHRRNDRVHPRRQLSPEARIARGGRGAVRSGDATELGAVGLLVSRGDGRNPAPPRAWSDR